MTPENTPITVSIDEAIALIRDGGVGVIPTDTVYGLVASAHNPKAVARFYALKNRDHKPGTIIAASTSQLQELGVDKAYLNRVQNLWPAPLSVETPLSDALSYLHQDTGRQGLRVVDDNKIRDVLEQTGPLVTSSANKPGEPGSVTVAQAWDYFKDTVDFYVDGGDRSGRAPSTLIRLLDDGEIEVIRPGAVKL